MPINPILWIPLQAVAVVSVVIVAGLLTGCVNPKDSILPSKYKRASQVDRYKTCVATSTNIRYNATSRPEDIVRQSMVSCKRFRDSMVSEYPKRWRESYANKIDAELYQREVAWVLETRRKER